MAFKMKGFSAKDPVAAFTKHDGPHPVNGQIKEKTLDDGSTTEYVEMDDGTEVTGSWNEVDGVSRENRVPVEATYPVSNGALDYAAYDKIRSAKAENQRPEGAEGDEQRRPAPTKKYKKGY